MSLCEREQAAKKKAKKAVKEAEEGVKLRPQDWVEGLMKGAQLMRWLTVRGKRKLSQHIISCRILFMPKPAERYPARLWATSI